MEHLVTRFTDHFYLALYVLMVVDTTGLPIPSELPLLYGGYLISQGKLDLVPAAFIAAAGALTGSLIAYAISRSLGRTVVLRWGRWVFLTEEHLHRSERWFERKGPAAVFFCRMIPVARALISIPAGIAEMDVVKFSIYSFAGALPWAFALLGVGWALGDSWKRVLGSFTLASIAIATVLIVVVVWWLVRRRAAARSESPTETEVR